MRNALIISVALLAVTGSEAQVKISEVWTFGGIDAETPHADYVELFNAGSAPQDVAGWSLRFRKIGPWHRVDLTGTIPAGGFFLVRITNPGQGVPLPAPDLTASLSSFVLDENATVALMSNTLDISACPLRNPALEDLVGIASSPCSEGATFPTDPLRQAILTVSRRCASRDSADNSNDLELRPPSPRNSAWIPSVGEVTFWPAVSPPLLNIGEVAILSVAVEPCEGRSTNPDVTVDLTAIGGSAAHPLVDNGVWPDEIAGDSTFTAVTEPVKDAGYFPLPFSFMDAESRFGASAFRMSVHCPGDITGNGIVQRDDLGIMLSRFGCCSNEWCWDDTAVSANIVPGPDPGCGPELEGVGQADLGLQLAFFGCNRSEY